MLVVWSNDAIRDLNRLRQFLAGVNPGASKRAFQTLRLAPRKLLSHPHLGSKLENFGDRQVRRLVVGPYELRYELKPDLVVVLRVFHGKEDRH